MGHACCRGSGCAEKREEGPHRALGPGAMSFLLRQPCPAPGCRASEAAPGRSWEPARSRKSQGGSNASTGVKLTPISRAPSLPRWVWLKGQENHSDTHAKASETHHHAAGAKGGGGPGELGGRHAGWQRAQSVWNRGRSPCCQHGGIRVRAAETRPLETVKIAGLCLSGTRQAPRRATAQPGQC